MRTAASDWNPPLKFGYREALNYAFGGNRDFHAPSHVTKETDATPQSESDHRWKEWIREKELDLYFDESRGRTVAQREETEARIFQFKDFAVNTLRRDAMHRFYSHIHRLMRDSTPSLYDALARPCWLDAEPRKRFPDDPPSAVGDPSYLRLLAESEAPCRCASLSDVFPRLKASLFPHPEDAPTFPPPCRCAELYALFGSRASLDITEEVATLGKTVPGKGMPRHVGAALATQLEEAKKLEGERLLVEMRDAWWKIIVKTRARQTKKPPTPGEETELEFLVLSILCGCRLDQQLPDAAGRMHPVVPVALRERVEESAWDYGHPVVRKLVGTLCLAVETHVADSLGALSRCLDISTVVRSNKSLGFYMAHGGPNFYRVWPRIDESKRQSVFKTPAILRKGFSGFLELGKFWADDNSQLHLSLLGRLAGVEGEEDTPAGVAPEEEEEDVEEEFVLDQRGTAPMKPKAKQATKVKRAAPVPKKARKAKDQEMQQSLEVLDQLEVMPVEVRIAELEETPKTEPVRPAPLPLDWFDQLIYAPDLPELTRGDRRKREREDEDL